MADEQSTDWRADGERWTRNFGGLDLSVWPDPDDPDEPWTYEVVLAEDDVTEYEIAMRGGVDLERMATGKVRFSFKARRPAAGVCRARP